MIPVLSQSLQLSPIISRFFEVWFQITAPGVSRSPSFPFALQVPGWGLSCNTVTWLVESGQSISSVSVGSPPPLSFDMHIVTTVPYCFRPQTRSYRLRHQVAKEIATEQIVFSKTGTVIIVIFTDAIRQNLWKEIRLCLRPRTGWVTNGRTSGIWA